MTLLYFKLAIAGILGGLIMIAAGLDMHWQGALAILAGLLALVMGIRDVTSRNRQHNGVVNNQRPPDGPYTAEDFPCPDPMPGRKRHWAGYDGWLDPPPEKDEVAFAVVVPKGTSSEQELKAIGQRLQVWKFENGFVRKIIGLELLLEGKFPESPAYLFWLPMPPLVEHVALVYVALGADTEQTAEGLNKALGGLSVAMVVSPAYYSQINR